MGVGKRANARSLQGSGRKESNVLSRVAGSSPRAFLVHFRRGKTSCLAEGLFSGLGQGGGERLRDEHRGGLRAEGCWGRPWALLEAFSAVVFTGGWESQSTVLSTELKQ